MILSNEYEIVNIFNLIRATLVALQQFTRLLEQKVWLFGLLQWICVFWRNPVYWCGPLQQIKAVRAANASELGGTLVLHKDSVLSRSKSL